MNGNSKKVNDIAVDAVHEQTKLKLFFGNDDSNDNVGDNDIDNDDDDDDKIDHASSSSSPPPNMMKIIMCSLAVIFVVVLMNHTTTTAASTSTITSAPPSPDDTTMLNQDMMLVGVQEQVEGVWCCPEDRDGCTSYEGGNSSPVGSRNCVGTGEGKSWNTLDDGTVCKPKIGGHCCADSTSKQYSWYYINIGGSTGCRKNSF